MRRRSRASSKLAIARSRKAKTLKAARHSGSSASGQETEVVRLRRELSEALEQQAATSEVLRVISGSPGELEPVFNAMLEKAVHICEAKFGVLFRHEGGMVHPTAMLDVPPAYAEFLTQQGAFAPQPGQLFGRICETKKLSILWTG
jgi:two-component system, NtrC family, sensor kinase